MKRLLVTSIAVIALTHSVHARTWAWFHGDVGLASPFVSSSSPQTKTQNGQYRNKKKSAHRAVAGSKSNSTDKRVTAR